MSEHHHAGLQADLKEIERIRLGRRRALGLIGVGGGALVLAGCGGSETSASGDSSVTISGDGSTSTGTGSTGTGSGSSTGSTSSSGSCTAFATETNGPYPADGTNRSRGLSSNVLSESGVVRSDIRSSFLGSSTTTVEGVELAITLKLVDVNDSCATLEGYAVYIWHCDVEGEYSLYDQPNESWLRGAQVADENGEVTFTTIWPGCYNGRFPHIHFEVYSSIDNATSGRYALLVSQIAMPDAVNDVVYASDGYKSSLSNYAGESISGDNVFGDNSSDQIEAMTATASGSVSAGYMAEVTVGLAT
ncbi:intradiol ring-cleavage dioxygenase [Croceicoccus sp. Ery15]|uniref:dioxygenase family protein n=1 Tax=Croceicoccus sp. Ery15 TaxID=1703338 RepID=UPI001E478C3A|nr:intradiol ring-cleavage dioxygenase [Croceicoccus sp. Ery15]